MSQNYLYENLMNKYRILVPIDQRTNDFPRNTKGSIDCNDYYISCRKTGKEIAQISWYNEQIMDCIVFTYNTGRKIVKKANEENISVFNVKEGDGEVYFRFDAKDMEWFTKKLGAMTQGKGTKPFSIKNLPKSDYKIPEEDLSPYKEIISVVGEGDRLIISRLTDEFLKEKVEKTLSTGIERELRYHKMSRQKKEYIHKIGLWEQYLVYLKEGLISNENSINGA